MRPQKPKTTGEGDLFRARLEQIINMKHELRRTELAVSSYIWPATRASDCALMYPLAFAARH